MQRFVITVTVRMAKLHVHNSGLIISVEKISIVVMHETETIETMRRN